MNIKKLESVVRFRRREAEAYATPGTNPESAKQALRLLAEAEADLAEARAAEIPCFYCGGMVENCICRQCGEGQ